MYFGTAGAPDAFKKSGKARTVDLPEWLAARGLNWLEVSFGRGVSMGEETARLLGENARKAGVRLSVHAPYYINLANPDPAKRERSREYIRESVQAAVWMEAERVIYHPGSAARQSRKKALAYALEEVPRYMEETRRLAGDGIWICPETMGKVNQLGDLQEVLALCAADPGQLPCIDFGHLHSRGEGSLRTGEDFARILDAMEEALGFTRVRNFHIHFSKMEYSGGGEIRHLTFEDTVYGPEFEPLGEILAKRGYDPVFISESAGTQEEDAAYMRDRMKEFTGLY
ncbi:MAG: TIM barrel protein [Christensenellales bacterium]|jgi:deoxyribonuclease-4